MSFRLRAARLEGGQRALLPSLGLPALGQLRRQLQLRRTFRKKQRS